MWISHDVVGAAARWPVLLALLQRAEAAGGFYAEKWARCGLTQVSELAGWQDFLQKVPFTQKAELVDEQSAHPPFGRFMLRPVAEYTRFCQTSGTSTGVPLTWLDTAANWSGMLEGWRRVFAEAGLVKGVDRVLFAFSFGPFLGFWTAFEAAAQDYLAIPGGGLSSLARLQMLARCEVTVLCCTPTYALRLGEFLVSVEGAALRGQLQVRKLILAGEPGGCVPAVRARLQALWGAEVFDHHGMTEVGPVSFQRPGEPDCLRIFEDAFVVEIVDPKTGAEVAEGECGELVLTTLLRVDAPLIRYRTGDWVRKVFRDGQLVLEGGILSRVDEMVLVRGVNVYPSAVEAVVREFAEVSEFVVEQHVVRGMTELSVSVEAAGQEIDANLPQRLEARLKEVFTLRIPVQLVSGLPKPEFKARRWMVK
jgi:phenylacetate-CoA ligase